MMGKVRLLFTADGAALGERIALALEAHGAPLAFGLYDDGDLDPRPVVATVVLWTPHSRASSDILLACDNAMAEGRLVPIGAPGQAPKIFERVPPIDLSGWTGRTDDPRWRFVLDEIELAASRGDAGAAPAADEMEGAKDVESQSPDRPLEDRPPPPLIAGYGPETCAGFDEAPAALPDGRAADGGPAGGKRRPNFAAVRAGMIAAFVVTAGGAFVAGLATYEVPGASAEAPASMRTIDVAGAPAYARIAPPGTGPRARADAPVIAFVDPVEPPVVDLGDVVSPSGESDGSPEEFFSEGSSADDPPSDDDFIGRLAWATSVENADEAIRDIVGEAAVAAAEAADLVVASIPAGVDASFVPGDAARAGARSEAFRDCDRCPLLLGISAGSFAFGSPASEAARSLEEYVARDVAISNAFAIGVHEVTFAEWDACVADGGCRGYRPSDVGWGRARRPVVNVSFDDAQAYVDWLSRTTGHSYRLPSEAEWEYAARAGAEGPFGFGRGLSPKVANYHGAYPYDGPRGVYRRRTTPAGEFEANAFGLYDVHGNVFEWTADCWMRGALVDSPGQAPVDAGDGGDCGQRVVKGGAWNSGGWRVRAAYRQPTPADDRNSAIGFRVVREL